ncbi:MAG: putative two component system response regulator [Myxococcaceae bacterium]|jgi:CheY-like chemotaxis protein|nr:putative two component system response regulator [Myxococcaceae bacterium]
MEPSRTNKIVLVVEDDESVRAMLVRALGISYTVLEAGDGMAAMELLRKGTLPDVILCDVMMPRMNGYALARIIKADPVLKGIPIVFLTARGAAKDIVEGINAGARHYIAKPFSVRDVLEKVGKIVK